MKMTNEWNRTIYRLWAPFYDILLGHFFEPGRKRSIELLNLKAGDRVLLVGVGTGEDLPFISQGVNVVGIDLSPEMLVKARQRMTSSGLVGTLIQGDAQKLLVTESSFDAVIFNLILSVIPDAAACLRENLRALKPGGCAVIFDKFRPDNGKPGYLRKFVNFFTTLGGTDITRGFDEISAGLGLKVICNEPSIMHGMYRVIHITLR